MNKKTREFESYLLVTVQFGCLAVLLITGPFLAYEPIVICIAGFSILLGLWAIATMSRSKITVFPILKEGAVFITKGPYRVIRHPMYLAIILFAFSLVLEKMNLFRILVMLILVLNLIVKIEFEEKILVQEFKEYKSYKKGTRKLIPFIY